jgi:type IV pilus assembly protein PilE
MNRKLHAFTLTELLVVLVIIGILALIALPDQSAVISRAKAQEAKLQLEHVYTLQQQYFYMNSKYSANLDEIDYEQVKLSSEGGNANYKIEIIEANPAGFKARATAIVDFDQDGNMNVWEIDQEKNLKEVTKD